MNCSRERGEIVSYVISDYNMLVHSVLPSLPPGPHPILFISLHFRVQRAPTPPRLPVCASLSRLHFQRAARVPLFRSRLPGFCFADLLCHSCRRIFLLSRCSSRLCFVQLCSACRCTVRSVLDVLFCFGWKPFLSLQTFLSGLVFI